jgi:ubiquinone/menaquinone biosynthesis C-methylase UbiE
MITDDYYVANVSKYTASDSDSYNVSMNEFYLLFEKYLKPSDNILDIGFGSGRDSLYFSSKYNVTSIDIIPDFIQHGKIIGLKNAILERVENMEYESQFDGIWACASLLHLNTPLLLKALEKIVISSKPKAIFYTSFKYGNSEQIIDGRYFNYMDDKKFNKIFFRNEFEVVKTIVTDDKLNRGNKWINAYILITK